MILNHNLSNLCHLCFNSDTSSKTEDKDEAEIPKFMETISNETFATFEVSITSLSELESGTDEFASSPPPRTGRLYETRHPEHSLKSQDFQLWL